MAEDETAESGSFWSGLPGDPPTASSIFDSGVQSPFTNLGSQVPPANVSQPGQPPGIPSPSTTAGAASLTPDLPSFLGQLSAMMVAMQQQSQAMQQQNALLTTLVQKQTALMGAQAASSGSTPNPPDPSATIPGMNAGQTIGHSSPQVPMSAPKGLSDKLMPSIPKAESERWVNRPLEVLGFRKYCEDLVSWLCLIDPMYQSEVKECLSWRTPLPMSVLSPDQVLRSQRLYHVLKQSGTSQGTTRLDILIRLFEAKHSSEPNGYELLRTLRIELGLRTRSECIFFRNSVLDFRFLEACDMQDNIRRLESEVFRYSQMLDTYIGDPATVRDLGLLDSDLYQLLVRCLSGDAKLYVQLNAPETFSGAKRACSIFYEKTVLNNQQHETSKEPLSLNEYQTGSGKGEVKKGPDVVCFRCGKRDHMSKDCRVRLPEGFRNKGKGKQQWDQKGKGKEKKGGKESRSPSQESRKTEQSPSHEKGKEKGKKGKKGKGKPKGKRAAEYFESEQQGDEVWSEIDQSELQPAEGRLCVLLPKHECTRCPEDPHVSASLRNVPKRVSFDAAVPEVYEPNPKVEKPSNSTLSTASESYSHEEAKYWLLDSGASRSVISESHLPFYKVLRKRLLDDPLVFSTASGEEMSVATEVVVEAHFWIRDRETARFSKRSFELRCLVSAVQHNLLSAFQVCRQGFKFEMTEMGCEVSYGSSCFDVEIFGNVPWISASIGSRKHSISGGSGITPKVSPPPSGDTLPDDDAMDLDSMYERAAKGRVKEPTSSGFLRQLHLGTSFDAVDVVPWISELSKTGAEPVFPSIPKGLMNQLESKTIGPIQNEPDSVQVGLHAAHDSHPSELDEPMEHPLPSFEEGENLVDDPSPSPQSESMSTEETSKAPDRLRERLAKRLFKHRLEGHSIYDPECDACRASRGVTHHRRRHPDGTSLEVVADIGVLTCFEGHQIKVLCLVEPISQAVAFVECRQSTAITRAEVQRYFEYIGLSATLGMTVLVKTDAEEAVGKFLRQTVACRVEKAPPQNHEFVGHAERVVRSMKEHLAVLRLDLQNLGIDIRPECIGEILTYISWTQNQFKRPRGGDKTAHELLCGQSRSHPPCTLFGALCFAEVPISISSPAGSRWVVGSFVGGTYGEIGQSVYAYCMVRGDVTLKRFKARSIRVMNKIMYDMRLSPMLLQVKTSPLPPGQQLEDARPLPLPIRASGPPADWLKRHGRTKDCRGCMGPSFGKRQHSMACKRRYQDWLEEQDKKLRVEPPPIDPSTHPTGAKRYPSKQPGYVHGPPASAVSPEPNWRRRFELDENDPNLAYEPEDLPSIPNPPLPSPSVVSPPIPLPPNNPDAEMELEDEGGPAEMDTSRMTTRAWTDMPEMLEALLGVSEKFSLKPLYLPKLGETANYEPFRLCESDIFLAEPLQVISEDGSQTLDISLAKQGRLTELNALNKVRFGDLLTETDAKEICLNEGVKIIGSRWVINPKITQMSEAVGSEAIETVRMRLVVQEIAWGSAAHLGLSSGTPSAESIRAMLTLGSQKGMTIATLDVSTAFLHSPIPPNQRYIIRLPGDLSWSSTSYQPVFADLHKALNGLRIGARAWINLVRDVGKEYGIFAHESETCIFKGTWSDGENSCDLIMACYVDDFLVVSSDPKAPYYVQSMLRTRVEKVKITGILAPEDEGALMFLGREIRRFGESKLFVRIPTAYLSEMVKDLKPTKVPPNIAFEDEDQSPLLDNEKASAFRSELGRFAWFCQTRVDMLRFSSLLAQGQANPRQIHEKALKKVLRFVKSCLHLWQVIEWSPSEPPIMVYADASWGVKSVSGFCIFWHGSLLKSVSRLQQAKSLSSCESELISISQASQETLGISRLLEFMSGGAPENINTCSDFMNMDVEQLPRNLIFQLLTDSSSALAIIQGDGLSRKVRHMSIAVSFVQRMVQQGMIDPGWVPTDDMIEDLLTKILDQVKTEKFRTLMGFVEVTAPEGWQDCCKEVGSKGTKPDQTAPFIETAFSTFDNVGSLVESIVQGGFNVLLFDLCTHVGFKPLHGRLINDQRIFVFQSTKRNPLEQAFRNVLRLIRLVRRQSPDLWIVGWLSPPCTGGSPAQYLKQENLKQRLVYHWDIFVSLLEVGAKVLAECDVSCLELSKACRYWGSDEVKDLCRSLCPYEAKIDRCAFSNPQQIQAKHTYRIQASVPMRSAYCRCNQSHLPFNSRTLHNEGVYPSEMVASIMRDILQFR